jgi:hypothetical protein
MNRFALNILCVAIVALGLFTGCTTTKTSNTARTSTEQLLISNSVDRALAKVDFRPFRGRAVFVEEKYLDSVDKNYVAGSIRHRVIHAGATLASKAEEADVILEVRSGGIGTQMNESYVGVPKLALPIPIPISIPQVKLWNKTSQVGTAKIGIVAYDAKTKRAFGTGGLAVARSDDNNWYVMGIGPYQNGSVRREVSRLSDVPARGPELPSEVAFSSPEYSSPGSSRVRLTSSQEPLENESPFERRR